jgi:16S rRNA (guanine527-N7)-methyltransferase
MSVLLNTVWLRTTCAQNGLTLDDTQLAKLEAFTAHLLEWNKKINLISRRDEENVWAGHILHSLSLLFKVSIPQGAVVLDLGTGGGLPGIPIKIARPDLNITLLDSTQKKTNVVKEIVQSLGLTGVPVVWSRAEDLAKQTEYKHHFDFVLARAVASLKDLVRWSSPLLKQDGNPNRFKERPASEGAKRELTKPAIIALKGGDLETEIRQTKNDPRVREISLIDLSLIGSSQFDVGGKKIVIVEITSGQKEKAK